jgi:AcrR family transcriptional regulator
MLAPSEIGEETHSGRGRPRSEASQAAVLAATTELLRETSLRDLSIEAIARKAGVGKITIYRWWPSKAYVALDAVMYSMRKNVVPPDTGSAERDFSLHLRSVIRFYTGPVGRTFRQLLAEGQNDPEFGEVFLQRFLMPRREVIESIWKRGVDRGDIKSDLAMDTVLDLISGPMIFRLLTGHASLSDTQADALIAGAFRGVGREPARPTVKGKR